LFFFEKKNQKTSIHSGAACANGGAKWIKVFLLLFLQKKKILPLSS